jgi:hypothetical protein
MEITRTSPTSIFIKWWIDASLNDFVVQYGYQPNTWQFTTKVSGTSVTLVGLVENQPLWVQVAATDNCIIGSFSDFQTGGALPPGDAATITFPGFPDTGNTLVPGLPDTGIAPENKNIPWGIQLLVLLFAFVIFYLSLRTYKFLSLR